MKPLINLENILEEKSTTELADNDVKVFEEIRMIQEEEGKEEDSVIMQGGQNTGGSKSSSNHEYMLKNLEEVF